MTQGKTPRISAINPLRGNPENSYRFTVAYPDRNTVHFLIRGGGKYLYARDEDLDGQTEVLHFKYKMPVGYLFVKRIDLDVHSSSQWHKKIKEIIPTLNLDRSWWSDQPITEPAITLTHLQTGETTTPFFHDCYMSDPLTKTVFYLHLEDEISDHKYVPKENVIYFINSEKDDPFAFAKISPQLHEEKYRVTEIVIDGKKANITIEREEH